MAGLLIDLPKVHGPWSLATSGYVEAFHVHGVRDTSIHAVLPSELAKEACEKGWGEPHTYADFDTQIMLYAPRNEDEILRITEFLILGKEFALACFEGGLGKIN